MRDSLARLRPAFIRPFARFPSDCRGISAVEFGLVGVPFLGLLMATLETGFVFLNSVGLQAAVQTAARGILTGTVQAAKIQDADTFRTSYICPATGQQTLPSFIDCSKLIVDVRTATSFASADTSKAFYKTGTQFCPGAPGTIVIVRVVYPMPVYLPIVTALASAIGQAQGGLVSDVPGNPGLKHLLMGTAVFQNEPYSPLSYSASASCS